MEATARQIHHQSSFVVVANRLAVDRVENPDGSSGWRTSPGGLVTALEPVMKSADHGAWVGWPGSPDEELEPFEHDGMLSVPVTLSAEEIEGYYEGLSNATLWPLYHDVIATPEFHREWWDCYVDVNRRFAQAAADVADEGATVWVQDYQLQLVPQLLRELRPDVRIGFFLHIPFPPGELFSQLPWRADVLRGLLGADLIGFQVPGGAQNFVRLVRQWLKLPTRKDTISTPDGRTVIARAYPISIDAESFQELALREDVQQRAQEIRADIGNPRVMFLGVDRLDYTKGIKQRIRAFGELVADDSISLDDVAFVQIATPSRERVEQYQVLRDEIDMLVGRINGDSGQLGRPVVTYLHDSFPRTEMAALYAAADVCVVTPLRDGMNLVCKEYVASRHDDSGALILSEFAGAAQELKQAHLVNPHDINGLKQAMLDVMKESPSRRKRRMRALRKQVFSHDIARWASSFLDDLAQVR